MWIQDRFGRKIELTEERWQHIVKEHPELQKLKDVVGEVLSNPDYVKRSKRDNNVELFYKFQTDLYKGKFLLVVIKMNARCFVLTAYITDTIKKGVQYMTNSLRMAYDKEGDILDLSLGEPKEAISREIEDDLFIRIDPETAEVIGISILNFEKWFEDIRNFRTLPILGTFEMPSKAA